MRIIGLVALAVAAPLLAQPFEQRRSDQERAYDARRQGRVLGLPEIEGRVVPQMRGAQYLGVELDGEIYTLKFLRNGQVIWVYVDGRSGQVIRRVGM